MPCLRSLDDLKKIMIDDLLLETHHRGSYIVLRCITPPDRMNAIMAIVEDETDDALLLQLYYQEPEADRAAEDFISNGVVLIVKEPYLRLMADGDCGIRVDHLSDIIFLSEDDELVPACWQPRIAEQDISAGVWKANGNDYFRQSKYYKAIE